MNKEKADRIIVILQEKYGDRACGLDFGTPYELLTATILSAQCTDVRVNMITEELFKVANTPETMLELGQKKLQEIIRPVRTFKNKIPRISLRRQNCCSKNTMAKCPLILMH